ncbi:MAG: TetR/AcrR family transcriptional regulator [Trebonia sp.]
MPKITAPTVAEHRAQRLRTLLAAARSLVQEGGPDALTLGALAQRVGMSRPGVYEYFRSRDDLLAAIIEDEMPAWQAELTAVLVGVRDPVARVAAYVAAQLRMLRDGRHAAAVALSAHAFGDDMRTRIRAEHDQLLEPLAAALAETGVPDPRTRAILIEGIVAAAVPLLAAGDAQAVIDAAVAQAVSGIADGLDRQPPGT